MTSAELGLDLDPDVELWDGEPVPRGQPTPRHEAIRVAIVSQLRAQLRGAPGTSVLVTSVVGAERTFPRSDASVLDTSRSRTPLWVEVLSESDLRAGDQRLTGGRRWAWLRTHGVDTLLAVLDVFGSVSATLYRSDGTVEAFIAPQQAQICRIADRAVTLDLADVQEAADSAPEELVA